MPFYTISLTAPGAPEYDQVLALREAVLRRPIGLSLKDEDLSGEQAETTLIATTGDGSVVACLMMRHLTEEEAKLRQMAVAPEMQGQGIGLALLQKAEELAVERGYRIISLHARETAVPFYLRAGYRVIGDVFTEVGIPHLFMNKRIDEVSALP